jgi:hypothetical protein
MAKLTSAERSKLPDSAFAGPGRSYPVEDRAHAIAAKSRASQFASPALKAKVDAKADKKLGKKSGAKK